jgi:hypothetical protein
MLSIERLWNALALGGVLSALLATAGVVNLGNLPHLPSFGLSLGGLSLGGLSLGGAAETATLALPAPTQAAPQPFPAPLQATLVTTEGPNPTLRAQDEIRATLLTTTEAYAYCYYADGAGSISRIYPNRFSPDPLVRGGRLELPDSTGAFALVADRPNRTEEVRCMTATSDLGARLPGVLQAEDLAPLQVASLNDITSMFRGLGAQVVEARLVAHVEP